MFELLLQAERAFADGALDQAERTYWQLIDLDPTNAMAVAGLARVALERGDQVQARALAERALSIDPDDISARRLLATIEPGANPPDESVQSDLPLLAAQQLEALSGRSGDMDEPRQKSAGHPSAEATQEWGEQPAGQRPPEPLRDRRQAGRMAAADAAAVAAAREPVRPRHEPHHAMPTRRRQFEPEDLKPPPTDAFFDAEMAAVVEAVEALDQTSPAAGSQAAEVEAVQSSRASQPEMSDESGADEFEAAEAVAVSQSRRGAAAPAHDAAPELGDAALAEAAASPATEESASGTERTKGPPSGTSDQTPSRAEPAAKEGSDVNAPRRKRGLFSRFRGN